MVFFFWASSQYFHVWPMFFTIFPMFSYVYCSQVFLPFSPYFPMLVDSPGCLLRLPTPRGRFAPRPWRRRPPRRRRRSPSVHALGRRMISGDVQWGAGGSCRVKGGQRLRWLRLSQGNLRISPDFLGGRDRRDCWFCLALQQGGQELEVPSGAQPLRVSQAFQLGNSTEHWYAMR